MPRKRLTQLFPWLLPLRQAQRKLFFYCGMRFDGNKYARTISRDTLPYEVFSSSCQMYNRSTGFDMKYQENKVFNLKLAAARISGLVIRPGETFSFWHCVRGADKRTPYKDALAEVDGRLVTQYGGGLCQISNLLCWVFLHTPLTMTERHGHGKKDFPEPPSDAPMGVDATVSEGWLDLRARNDTGAAYQIILSFDGDSITGAVRSDADDGIARRVFNTGLRYFRENGKILEEVDVVQSAFDRDTGKIIAENTVYRNKCEIGYELPSGTVITEKG